MMTSRVARRVALGRLANSSDHWLDGHAQNDRKTVQHGSAAEVSRYGQSAASARGGRRSKVYRHSRLCIDRRLKALN